MQRLTHAIISDLTEIGERGLGRDRTEPPFDCHALQQLRCSHRLAESKYAGGVRAILEPIDPLMNVLAFQQAVGGERASTFSVSAGVGHKDGIPGGQEELGIPNHSAAVIAHAMQHYDCTPIGCGRLDQPCLEIGLVRGSEGDILQLGTGLPGDLKGVCQLIGVEWAAGGMKGVIGHEDASNRAKNNIGQ